MVEHEKKFRHDFAEVNDIRLHYVSCGRGRLILFLHGFPEFWAAWEHQLIAFGRDYHSVAVDLRGYNLSSKPQDPRRYHIKELTEDIRALVDHLGHKTMTLVAHDWGGGVAWAFANRHPQYVEKLVIINSPHPAVFARELLENPRQQAASGYMNLFRTPDAERQLSANDYAFLAGAFTGKDSPWRMSEAMRRRYVEAWSQPGALTGGLNYYRISPLHPPTNDAEKAVIRQIAEAPRAVFAVTVPTLVIWGERDEALLIGNLDGLDAYVDDLTVRRIPDGSHWVVHEHPDLVNEYIQEFTGGPPAE